MEVGATAHDEDRSPDGAGGRIRILVVDDEPVNQLVMHNHLTLENFEVIQADSGVRALELLEGGEKVDLILLDVMMPKLSGFEVCREIRKTHLPTQLPVVMVTARNQTQDLKVGLQVGANDYVTKPVAKGELLARIRTHLNLLRINSAYSYYVPHEFLKYLSRESITDVHARRQRRDGSGGARVGHPGIHHAVGAHDARRELVSANELHRLASQWFANEELFPEAIHHALAGIDWERAADLISNQSTLMLRRGELVTLLGWLKSLPDEVIRARPHLCSDYGWALMLTGRLDDAAVHLDCAERALQGKDAELGQIMVAQAYLARVRGDYPRAITLSKQALEFVAKDDILHRGLVTFTLGFSLFSAGHIAEAEPVLLEACETARASGNDFARQTALSLLAAIQKNQGRLRRAAEFCKQTLQ